jgi:WD40 repeat protein
MGGEVQVAAVDADESRRIANHGAPIFDAVFSADGKTLFAVGTDGRTGIWDVATGEQLHALESEGIAMSLSPDGSRLATMSARGGFIVWEVGTGAEVLRGPGPDDELGTSIAFSPDGASLAVGGERSTVVVDAGTGAELATLHGRPATGLLSPYSPDGNLLALVAGDGAVELYRGTESIGALLGHTRRAVSAAWSADGARLVTASPDGSVRLWEVVEGARLLTIRGATPATFARLAAGDGHVISAFADGTLRVDAVAPRALLDQACAAIERFGDLDAVAPHCSDFADRPPTATRDETD